MKTDVEIKKLMDASAFDIYRWPDEYHGYLQTALAELARLQEVNRQLEAELKVYKMSILETRNAP